MTGIIVLLQLLCKHILLTLVICLNIVAELDLLLGSVVLTTRSGLLGLPQFTIVDRVFDILVQWNSIFVVSQLDGDLVLICASVLHELFS